MPSDVVNISKKAQVNRFNTSNDTLSITIKDSKDDFVMLSHEETMALIKILNEWKDWYFDVCADCGVVHDQDYDCPYERYPKREIKNA